MHLPKEKHIMWWDSKIITITYIRVTKSLKPQAKSLQQSTNVIKCNFMYSNLVKCISTIA